MNQSSRHDQKLELILRTSARIFAEKSYHSTSMRDISRATGVSLAGLYHYCKSKEELLFLIQDHCFGRVLERLESRLCCETDPVQKLRVLVENHLAFFASNMAEMKVLSHEAESLSGEWHIHVSGKKEKYTKAARKILREIQSHNESTVDLTVATYALFGMMNWIYNWYNPRGKISVNDLVNNIMELFLGGFMGSGDDTRQPSPTSSHAEPFTIWRGGLRTTLPALLVLTLLSFCHPLLVAAQPQSKGAARANPTPAQSGKVCYGDPVYGGNIRFERISQEPRIGIKTEGYPKGFNKEPAPKNMLTVFLVVFEGVQYRVFVDSKNVIQRVTTGDNAFKTAEGISVGDALEKVIAAAKTAPVNKFTCGYSVLLPSGWEAWFGPDSQTTDGQLVSTAVVKSFQLSARSTRSN